jgi:hypothetical protein
MLSRIAIKKINTTLGHVARQPTRPIGEEGEPNTNNRGEPRRLKIFSEPLENLMPWQSLAREG